MPGEVEAFAHLVRFYGVYANRIRATYRAEDSALPGAQLGRAAEATPRSTLSKRWRELIYRIYEVDPLTCSRCGAKMRILAFLTEPNFIRRTLDHLQQKARPRAPPQTAELNLH